MKNVLLSSSFRRAILLQATSLVFVGILVISCTPEEIDTIVGCTDQQATNFDPEATVEDESCRYNCSCDCSGWQTMNEGTINEWEMYVETSHYYNNITADGIATAMMDCSNQTDETYTSCQWAGCD